MNVCICNRQAIFYADNSRYKVLQYLTKGEFLYTFIHMVTWVVNGESYEGYEIDTVLKITDLQPNIHVLAWLHFQLAKKNMINYVEVLLCRIRQVTVHLE